MILSMENLNISFRNNKDYKLVVRDLNLHISAGEMLGVVGESGSGKSLTNLALMGLLPKTAKVDAIKLKFKEHNLLSFTSKDWQSFRGNEIAMIFQDPKSAMNPSMKIKTQLLECIKKNKPGKSKKDMLDIAQKLLDQVGLRSAKNNLENYPHELSGGMTQRVMIAMALACDPSLLIADEPTTGLDPINSKQILQLLNQIRYERNMSIIFVSHDINLIQEHSQRVNVMYSGELMETGPTQNVMSHPKHPYTKGLINCLPHKKSDRRKQHLNTIEGLVLPITEKVDGCRFYNRCPDAHSKCLVKKPLINKIDENNYIFANCHLYEGA